MDKVRNKMNGTSIKYQYDKNYRSCMETLEEKKDNFQYV